MKKTESIGCSCNYKKWTDMLLLINPRSLEDKILANIAPWSSESEIHFCVSTASASRHTTGNYVKLLLSILILKKWINILNNVLSTKNPLHPDLYFHCCGQEKHLKSKVSLIFHHTKRHFNLYFYTWAFWGLWSINTAGKQWNKLITKQFRRVTYTRGINNLYKLPTTM